MRRPAVSALGQRTECCYAFNLPRARRAEFGWRFHALGTLMAVGIMILPAAAARFWSESIGGLITAAVTTATLSSVSGLLLSYYFSLPSGPAIILVIGVFYALSIIIGPVGGLIAKIFTQPRIEY